MCIGYRTRFERGCFFPLLSAPAVRTSGTCRRSSRSSITTQAPRPRAHTPAYMYNLPNSHSLAHHLAWRCSRGSIKVRGRASPLFHATDLAAVRLHLLAISLHKLVRLHVRLEELGGAAVEADGLALVDLALAVVGGDAFPRADLGEAVTDSLGFCAYIQPIVFSSDFSPKRRGEAIG